MDKKHLLKNPHIVSIGLLIASFPFDCFACEHSSVNSFTVLLVGWMGMFKGGANSTWLANPLLAMSWLFFEFRYYFISAFTGFLASIIAFSFLFCQMVVIDEGGAAYHISSVQIGYWLWLLSCITIFAGGIYNSFLFSNEKKNA